MSTNELPMAHGLRYPVGTLLPTEAR